MSAAATCPLCDRPGVFAIARPDVARGLRPDVTHAYFSCAPCQHLFAPVVATELLLSFYPPAYYQAPGRGLRSSLDRLRQRNRARSLEWRAHKGRALDIGCGRGMVLEQLRRRGWRVSGMDWNPHNARAVADRLQIEVAAGDDGLSSFEAESFDAISMFHVLEHEQRPLDLLHRVHRILKPGGRLLVGVPNAHSLARRLFGSHWSGYDFSRHRQVFSPHSLRSALALTGFQCERQSGRFSDELLDVQASVELALRGRRFAAGWITAVATLATMSLLAVPRLFGLNSVVYAYARRQ